MSAVQRTSPAVVQADALRSQGRLLDAADCLDEALRDCDAAQADELYAALLEALEEIGDVPRIEGVIERINARSENDCWQSRLRILRIFLSQGRFYDAAVDAAKLARLRNARAAALGTLVVAAAMLGRTRLSRLALTRLKRTGRGADPQLMAGLWRRAMLGRLLRTEHDARMAGADPPSSVLHALIAPQTAGPPRQ